MGLVAEIVEGLLQLFLLFLAADGVYPSLHVPQQGKQGFVFQGRAGGVKPLSGLGGIAKGKFRKLP